jgi:lipid II:glycine glycyltransferase (peptidoglycan interpeptide bridge formation enzyme)
MLTNEELWGKCSKKGSIIAEDLGIHKNSEPFIHICGGYTFYKDTEGVYRYCGSNRPATKFQIWFYKLK